MGIAREMPPPVHTQNIKHVYIAFRVWKGRRNSERGQGGRMENYGVNWLSESNSAKGKGEFIIHSFQPRQLAQVSHAK